MSVNNLPPHNTEAECAVIGSCIISREAIGSTAEVLKPEDFYDPSNRKMWEIISDMYIADRAVDVITVADELERRGDYERLGGRSYLYGLVDSIITTGNVNHYADIIRDCALRRRLIDASDKIAHLASKYDTEGREIIEKTEQIIFEAVETKSVSHPFSLNELTPPAFRKIEESYRGGAKKITGFPSGFEDLDNILARFQPGSLNVIAARPSMGKTALALNIAQFGGERGNNPYVLIFSLEMPAEQLVYRMFAAEAGVSMSAMNKGAISEDDFYRLTEVAENLSRRNIYINDDSNLTSMDFRTKCRRFKTRYPELALIIVDYIQLMRSGSKRSDNRQNEVAEISRSMKAVALEMGCPVIALSQLSRETERRTEKKPQLWDLRDSGAIEQDADTVILLYREDYYSEHENNSLTDSKADLRIAKNRNGGTGTCHLTFQREYTRFVGYTEER